MHPLHQDASDVLLAHIEKEPYRLTGRSTAQALGYLSRAIKSPNTRVYIQDHHGTPQADRHLTDMISEMVQKLGLRHMSFGKSVIGYWVCFGDTPKGANGKAR